VELEDIGVEDGGCFLILKIAMVGLTQKFKPSQTFGDSAVCLHDFVKRINVVETQLGAVNIDPVES